MEVEIDPLSMLEQTMQVDENCVASNDDEDVVCLTDLMEPEVVEVLDDDDMDKDDVEKVSSTSIDPANLDVPKPALLLGTMPNGSVLLDPDSDNVSIMLNSDKKSPRQPMPLQVQQEMSIGFGQHFLLNPGPSSSFNDSSPVHPENSDSPPIPKPAISPRVNGKGKINRLKNVAKSRRGKGYNRMGNSAKMIQCNSTPPITNTAISPALASQKLVGNVRRLSSCSEYEQTYRNRTFSDLETVLRKRLDCTICGIHIGASINLNVFRITHPLLKVLCCSKCRETYCNTDWTLGSNKKDIRCRWCSFSANEMYTLKNCSNCPFAFCNRCINQNFSKKMYCQVKLNPNWLCFVCQMVPLYCHRATCWALGLFISNLHSRKNRGDYTRDISMCCKGHGNSAAADIVPRKENPVKTISSQAMSSRIEVMISSIETINKSIKLKLTSSLPTNKIDDFVSNINVSLASIGSNVESCLEYIENWRAFTLRQLKEGNSVEERNCEVKPSKVNGSQDYSCLLKKFNIKPCRVVIERLKETTPKQSLETSQPPNFFFSLLPPPDNDDVTIVDDEIEIICLDD